MPFTPQNVRFLPNLIRDMEENNRVETYSPKD